MSNSDRLRILFVIHDFLPRHRAGSEIYAYNLAAELAAEHEVSVFTTEASADSTKTGRLVKRKYKGLDVYEHQRGPAPGAFDGYILNTEMNMAFERMLSKIKPDIVHFHHLMHHSFDYPEILERRNIPSVFTLHDFFLTCPTFTGGQRLNYLKQICDSVDPELCVRCINNSVANFSSGATISDNLRAAARIYQKASPLIPKCLKSKIRKLASALIPEDGGARMNISLDQIKRRQEKVETIYNSIDLFIAPSNFLRKVFIDSGAPPEKIIYSDYGFDKNGFDSVKRRAAGNKVTFGFIGTPVFHKGVNVLIEAFKKIQIKYSSLIIYGNLDIFPKYSTGLVEAARGADIKFAGPFDPGAAPKILAELDALIVPSIWYENSPLTIHEAFMAGVPVITSDIGGMAELVADGENGLHFRVGDSGDLAEVINRFAGDPVLRKKLALGAAQTKVKSIADDSAWMVSKYRDILSRTRS